MTTMTRDIHTLEKDAFPRDKSATIASISDQDWHITRTYGVFHIPACPKSEPCALLVVTPRADAIAEAMRRAGILGGLSTNIRAARWDKLMWNAAFNTVTTLTRRTVGEVLDDPEGYALVRNLMMEVRATAAAQGVELSAERVAQVLAHSDRNLRPVRTSTLQDLERGKPLEVEALIGVVVKIARRAGIKTPFSEAIYALMRLTDRAVNKS
jgi:2-dehydropantoate 2-reductase